MPSGVMYGPPASAVGTHTAGMSKLSAGAVIDGLLNVAFSPSPLSAKMRQRRQKLAPPLLALSAAMIPSRASM